MTKLPKRPENIDVSDFDSFKNNAFDILDQSIELKTDATKVDTDVKAYWPQQFRMPISRS